MADEHATSPPDTSPRRYGPITVAGRTLHRPAVVVLFALVVAVVGLVVSQAIPLAVFRGLATVGVSLPQRSALTLQLVLTELVGFGGMAWLYLRVRGLPRSYVHLRWPTGRDVVWMVGGTVLALVLYFGVVTVAVAAGVPMARSVISQYGQSDPGGLLVVAVLSLVLVGPMEELFFRGVVQETMREALPANVAVPLASAVFALVHLLTLTGPLLGQTVLVGSLFVTALVLGYAYERTGNLAVNAAIHGGYNAVLLVLAYLVFASGMAPTG